MAHSTARAVSVPIQHVVDGDVDDQRHDRHPQRDLHRFRDAQRAQHHRGQPEEHVGKADDGKIGHALADNLPVPGEQPHRARRGQRHRRKQRKRQPQRRPRADGRQLADLAGAPLAPVLAAQHDHAVADAVHQLLQHELDLVHRGHAGQGALAVRAQHHVVRQVHRQDHRLLQHQRQAEPHKRPVEFPITGQSHLTLSLLSFLRFRRCSAAPAISIPRPRRKARPWPLIMTSRARHMRWLSTPPLILPRARGGIS